jgi:UDP-N-acetyl-2-amino-2-deoxyglucuronate dehydrogenase
MADRTFGLGIIGCGVIAPFHARAAAELPNVRLVAVADTVAEAAARRGAEFGVEHHADVDALLERPDVDVVSVCVPSGMHAEIGSRAAAAGKHVVMEKPIDVTLEAADRLIAACRRHGVALTVISQHRFGPAVRRMRELIDAGRLGRLVVGDALVKWYRSQAYYDSGDWRGTWSLDGGGCLMNQGVHYVDLLQWMMGPVDRVFGRCATAAHERIEVEDVAAAVLRFSSGAVGLLQASTAIYPGLPERLEVTGTGGTVIVESGALRACELKDEKGETSPYGGKLAADRAAAEEGGAADPAAISHAGHRAQIADFLEAIETGRPPLVTGEEARKPLELILAVYRSAREGREVTLPLAAPTGPG